MVRHGIRAAVSFCKLYTLRGTLAGPMEIAFGGLARPVGQTIARKLGIPVQAGRHTLRVEIGHRPDCLLWSRRFDGRQHVDSTFPPVGAWTDGMCWSKPARCA